MQGILGNILCAQEERKQVLENVQQSLPPSSILITGLPTSFFLHTHLLPKEVTPSPSSYCTRLKAQDLWVIYKPFYQVQKRLLMVLLSMRSPLSVVFHLSTMAPPSEKLSLSIILDELT